MTQIHSPRGRVLSWAALGLALLLGQVVQPAPAFAACTADRFCCSAGSNNTNVCDFDSDCPGGACVAPFSVCAGGTNDGAPFCGSSSECPGGTCASTASVCTAGENKGFPCTSNNHCPGGTCSANGLFCFGGDFDRFPCVDSNDCTDVGANPGVCRAPATPIEQQLLCSAGSRDGLACDTEADCPNGVCVFAQNVCDGGSEFVNGFFCTAETDCEPGVVCQPTQKICTAGDTKGFGCTRQDHCSAGSCAATGQVCEVDSDFGFSCVDNTDCDTSETCSAPLCSQ